MALDQRKYEKKHTDILRDVRSMGQRVADTMEKPNYSAMVFLFFGILLFVNDWVLAFADLLIIPVFLFFIWVTRRSRALAFKLPIDAPYKDPNNEGPGRSGEAEGIMYLGNMKNTNEEVWFTNSDIRTHILYLGTTGAGKTEGLKSMVTNAMAWGSGFVYVDGKADTDLWSSLSALVRRFGRDDDLLVLNYMTGNADGAGASNTMNPFSSGSASYLTNMLVQLMPEGEGDNAMWKERAVALASAIMPILTWKRDNQEVPMSVRNIREHLEIGMVIKLQRDKAVPEIMREGVKGYLDTLPGFTHEAYDDEGKVKPPGGDTPQYDTTTASQQHGYLAMQFTRSLQSLGDDYGYIFDTQAADVDMTDVVLNRRIMVTLIPALEKSGDEIANLGKIVAATLKGMMGSTLGSQVEGESSKVIDNKPTHSATPYVVVFDEVGYYATQGMAVMAAQARSLGFCLIFSGQDLPAMKKRVREEAQSITANCNIKIFGKLEDPTETKEFFEKTVGQALVTELSGFQMAGGNEFGSYFDTQQASVQTRARASYDGLRSFKEGEAVLTFGEVVIDSQIFYSNPGKAKAMRVTRFMSLAQPDENMIKYSSRVAQMRDLLISKDWTAKRADVAVETEPEIAAMAEGFKFGADRDADPVQAGMAALVQVHALTTPIEIPDVVEEDVQTESETQSESQKSSVQDSSDKPPASQTQQGMNGESNAKPEGEPLSEAPAKDAPPRDAPMSFFHAQDKDTSNGEGDAPTPQAPTQTQASAPVSGNMGDAPLAVDGVTLSDDILSMMMKAGEHLKAAIFKDDTRA